MLNTGYLIIIIRTPSLCTRRTP